jgi:hypothetical protein
MVKTYNIKYLSEVIEIMWWNETHRKFDQWVNKKTAKSDGST